MRSALHALPSAAVVLLGLGLGAGCGGPDEPQALGPVLLVGMDGLDPTIVAELLHDGRLPNFARFAEQGVLGRLTTLEPTYSPVIWTTIATGQALTAHGIDFFIDTRSTGLPYTSEARRVPALWNIVSDAGLGVDVVGWWVSWPAEPVNGRILASYAAQAQAHVIWKAAYDADQVPEQTWPEDLWDVVRDDIVFAEDREQVQQQFNSRFKVPDIQDEPVPRLVRDLAWTLSADRSNLAVAERFLSDDPGDLVMTYLGLPDVAGHRFWRYHAPGDFHYEVPPAHLDALGDVLNLAYVDVDEALGRLMSLVDERWTILLCSDHGMHADPLMLDDPVSLGSGHHLDAPPGIFGALGRGIAAGGEHLGDAPLGTVFDVAPTVLRLLGLPQPEHWPSVASGNGLDRVLDPEFARANPARTCESPDLDWVRAHPRSLPRSPTEHANEDFTDQLDALGYLDSLNKPTGDADQN
ncbi:alkaline phosphatase family protein [Engelhardtia mirabilis]|uniref:Type I phosphodiesterase / nucleotide pyrophosphatase n=1 Tax=Engelhardtia mirabilis TaxID=2528011 RepID=A0A518BNW1_9BACT|nr:Type I phosphodiesterase / nucleotide pyrophosphatase [Planctomycetes bacterium Pla133]QDV02999.1 Type I phosphodiesterase / nucleotide pyrophosphatase [Planctomycetes bacterium Pla86]